MPTRVGGITLDTTKLDRITANLRPKAGQIIRTSAYAVLADAQMMCPVDTSNLKNSLDVDVKSDFLAWVHDGTEYGIYQETGFHHWISGTFIQNPFLVPAVEKEHPRFEEAWKGLFE